MLIDNRYQVQDIIGRGSIAITYRGWDLERKRVVALKVIREAYGAQPEFVARLPQIVRAARSLEHPTIVPIYDAGRAGDTYFLVMELIEGIGLNKYLRSQGALPPMQAVSIGRAVASGLGNAHSQGIVHGNVKLQNVLIDRAGGVRLTDFAMEWGLCEFPPPEWVQGKRITPETDVYALGCLMYCVLTGRVPFDGDTPVQMAMQHVHEKPVPPGRINPRISSSLEEIILRCMEKAPGMRFGDGKLLAAALEALDEADVQEGPPLAE